MGTQAHLPPKTTSLGWEERWSREKQELDAPGSQPHTFRSGPKSTGTLRRLGLKLPENRQVAESSLKRHRDPKVGQEQECQCGHKGTSTQSSPQAVYRLRIHVGEMGSPAPSTNIGMLTEEGRALVCLKVEMMRPSQNHTYAKLGRKAS